MHTDDVYHSRTQADWEIVERRDPVLWPNPAPTEGPLDAAQVDAFERDGFVILPGLIDDREVDELREGAGELAAAADVDDELVVAEPESRVVRSIFRVHHDVPLFAALAVDPRLAGAARQILGSEVYIHQSRVNFKPGFDGREFYWHSDFETWHVEDGMPRMRALSATILLTDNTPLNGPLMLVPGSHRAFVRCVGRTPENHHLQSLVAQHYGVPSREALTQLVREGGIVQATGLPGTVVLFDCNTMHGSAGNLTPHDRHNVFLVYNSVENRLVAPFGGLAPRPDFLAERDPAARLDVQG